MLTLIFVETLNLYIENRVGIKLCAGCLLYIISKGFFVAELDFLDFSENLFIVFELSELFELVAVVDEAVTDKLCDVSSKLRVSLAEPSSVSDTVGNIFELVGSNSVVIVEKSSAGSGWHPAWH